MIKLLVSFLCVSYALGVPCSSSTKPSKCQSGDFLAAVNPRFAAAVFPVHDSLDVKGNGCSTAAHKLDCTDCSSDPALISVSGITLTQGGKSVDDLGGLDLCQAAQLTISATNNYGTVASPMVRLRLYTCNKGFLTGCAWHDSIANALLPDFDPCSDAGISLPDCHLNNFAKGSSGSITATINLLKNPNIKSYLGLLPKGEWYEIDISFMDGSKVLFCRDITDYFKNISC